MLLFLISSFGQNTRQVLKLAAIGFVAVMFMVVVMIQADELLSSTEMVMEADARVQRAAAIVDQVHACCCCVDNAAMMTLMIDDRIHSSVVSDYS